MSEDRSAEWLDHSRRFAFGDLDKVRSMLQGHRVVVGLLFNDMRGALHWALEYWLRRRGESVGGGWTEQEARFLSLAPPDLQDDYLGVAGAVTRLACNLLERLGSGDVQDVAIDAPSLASWREMVMEWTQDALIFVGKLVESEVPRPMPGGRRVERGALQGRLDDMTPCLMLAQAGGGVRRWRRGGDKAGLFDFGEATLDGTGNMVHKGLLLPLALCRDASLQQKLAAFVSMVQNSAGQGAQQWAADRHRELQDWLEREGLETLRLANREPVLRWTRFSLTRSVFSGLLQHFNYVTAVADDRGQPCRILDHAPFAWTSQGDILDWRMGDDQATPVSPFHLYLATDVSRLSDPFRPGRDRLWQFRPVSYWTPFTRPAESVRSAAVSVWLTQDERDYGWVDLHLTLGDRTALITLSDVYDPFPALLDWLQAVADGDLPIGVTVDEEGSEARLIAHHFDESCLLVTVLDRWEETERASAVVEREAFLGSFRQEFQRFLRSELNMELWNSHEEDDAVYVGRLLAHSFLGQHSAASDLRQGEP